MADEDSGKMGYWAVVAMGIGGMVGGGIFAVLGLAVKLAHGATFIAFALAGIVALLTTYSYVKLSIRFPSRGGTVTFLDHAFGPGFVTGGLNVLLWLSYIVMLSLYAHAFGSYGAALISPSHQALWTHVLIVAIVLLVTGLNLLSAKAVGEAETWIVGLKVTILLSFIGMGIWGVDTGRLAPSQWARPLQLAAGGMIIFLAYEGFELIANTGSDVKDPERTLPRAYYSAVIFVIVLYVLVAWVTVGSLPVARIVKAEDYALAVAAEPFMGQAGFTLIAVAAMLSTASALNATVYSAARVSYAVAKDGELPAQLDRKIWREPLEGLLITSGATLLVANLFDLSNISTMGSAGFLLIFAAVNAANAKLSRRTGGRWWISLVAVFACLGALGALCAQTAMDHPARLWVLAALVGLAFLIEGVYRLATGRSIHTRSGG